MVPAALIGMDVGKLLENATLMVNSCRPSNPPQQNTGVVLGAMLGVAAKAGRDKLTLIASRRLVPFGSWVEQLIAESPGKQGRGIVPVDVEPLGAASACGHDRVFAYLRLDGEVDAAQDAFVTALAKAGHPVVTISLDNVAQLQQEFFRWEIATAVAGAVIGIHPFDQPDVEAAKIQARAVLDAFERDRRLPEQTATLRDGALSFYAGGESPAGSSVELLRHFLGQIHGGDYFAVQIGRASCRERV